jgi:hypothetical protein
MKILIKILVRFLSLTETLSRVTWVMSRKLSSNLNPVASSEDKKFPFESTNQAYVTQPISQDPKVTKSFVQDMLVILDKYNRSKRKCQVRRLSRFARNKSRKLSNPNSSISIDDEPKIEAKSPPLKYFKQLSYLKDEPSLLLIKL